MMPEITEDRLLSGRVILAQPCAGHRAGTDAVLLAAAVSALPVQSIIDVGAASGAVGLMLCHAKPDVSVTCLEEDNVLADLCCSNIKRNGFDDRARSVQVNIFDSEAMTHAGIEKGLADLVVSNPPFLEEGQARITPDARKRKAHVLPKSGLQGWIALCASLLHGKGTLALIHRADKLLECLSHMPKDFGAYRIRMVHPRIDAAAVRVIILATRNRRTPLTIERPLILHENDGSFTLEAQQLHAGQWVHF